MKRRVKYIIIVLACITGIFAMNAGYPVLLADYPVGSNEFIMPDDTVKPRTTVKKTVPEEYDDLKKTTSADLRDPENLKTEVEYDINTGNYLFRSKIGDFDLGTPFLMTPKEYQNYSLKQSLDQYFRERNKSSLDSALAQGRGGAGSGNMLGNLMDIQFDLGGADKLFGPGGVRLRPRGSVGMDLGLKTSKTQNPTLPEKSRSRTFFNFNTDVDMNVRASVGTKIDFTMNYNTGNLFDYDASRLRLGYSGEEDEIVKLLTGGQVSMQTNNSLINGGQALFGIRSDLQFGKTTIKLLLAQQESESRTVSTKGGAQLKNFAIKADEYDDGRHFFLAHYFRDTYDKAMSKAPYITSPIVIDRVEVWITNKTGSTGQTRNVVAFSDLGEYSHISNPLFSPSGGVNIPHNNANTLYRTIIDNYSDARDISLVTRAFDGFIEGGQDYENAESARMLTTSDYRLNQQLGYISLNRKLQPDEILAVAFRYTYNGTEYQVGEFSGDDTESTNKCLFLKMLTGTTTAPTTPYWDLMMKNIYSIPFAYQIQKTKFRFDITYQSDTAGTYVYTIPEGNIKDITLLKVMNLDRLNTNNEVVPGGAGDGFFDFLENYTIDANNGSIIFPVVEPFGSHLRQAIGNNSIADKYVYQELYDSTMTIAKQIAEKNKFIMSGQYTGSTSGIIELGSTNIPRGSVRVRSNGILLTENVDYTVNYSAGIVTIINDNYNNPNSSIDVSLDSNPNALVQNRKTMVGADINHAFSKNFNVGATVMHLSEMPVIVKSRLGDESVKNTLWGFNLDYKGESQMLTNMFDRLPLLSLSQPSTFSINTEFAHLIAGHYRDKYAGDYSYLDDFESTQWDVDLMNPYFWNLASTPYDDNRGRALFPEAGLSNNIDYGKNRALLAWYNIDPIFTHRVSNIRPSYMTMNDISNHYVRAVLMKELFPNRDLLYNDNNYQTVLNMAYYPNERGPYNLDADNLKNDGSLMNPEKRWGGMMRSLDQTDFEAANIQYIELWVMDPFIYNRNAKGGDLYFNLGEISEDVLKDGKKFFENGMPVDGDMSQIDSTVWGRVSKQQSTVYAFDNTPGTRRYQDVGFNGLSTEEESTFPTYADYLTKIENTLPQETILKMRDDAFSPFNDPSGDNFRYFRSYDYDREQADILTRYKRINGVEGNSRESSETQESYGTSSKMLPDVEDFNRDNTLNEHEKYYQYKVSIRPEDMNIGSNYIVDKRSTKVNLPNGTDEEVTWYQFKIPIKEYSGKVGSISGFNSIRFLRTFMTGFEETTVLRFGKFAFVRGDWRPYEQPLYRSDAPPTNEASLSISKVNIEENSDRLPINYVLPPGVTRITDPGQPQLRQQNEQSLSLKVENLAPQDARAVYKTTSYDLRRYKRMQLFVHAEKLIDDITDLVDDDISVFIRLGSDYKNNYYEYEVPLLLTPFGNNERSVVWRPDNTLDIRLDDFTNLKLDRNRSKSNGQATYNTLFSQTDPDPTKTRNTMSVIGNPTLSDVQVIMIGIRNKSRSVKSAEIWVNELRLTDFDESGGWAANSNVNLAISDFATISATGRIITAGFGSLDQSTTERSLEDNKQFSIATTVQLGKVFPEKARVSLPLFYSYSKEVRSPQYNPLDQDILLAEAINNEPDKAGKDSIRSFANDVVTTKALAFNNVKVDIRSKKPMPYDPVNFSMGYATNTESRSNPETEYETTKNFQANLDYNYIPFVKPFTPFSKIEKNKYLKQLSFNYLPSLSVRNLLTRNYYEIQLRDLNNLSNSNSLPVSFSQNFMWDRAFEIRLNLLSTLQFHLTSGTNARIEEGFLQANKNINRDDYDRWKDTVMKSIADLGTPLLYDQKFLVTYNLPFINIPVLDWVNTTVNYSATYNWEKGAYIDEETVLGNSIKNSRDYSIQGGFSLLSLYNKNAYLKKIIQKSNAIPTNRANPVVNNNRRRDVDKEVKLNLDSGTIVTHPFLTDKVIVTARRTDDSSKYKVSFKAVGYGSVRITNKDTVNLKVTIRPAPPKEDKFIYKLGEYSARTLMMVRKIDFNIQRNERMYIPGFMPQIGNWFGQGSTYAGRAPGLGFAFGDVRRSFINEAVDNGWLINDENNVTPAMINSSLLISGQAQLEPLPGFKLTLTSNYSDSRDVEVRYMYSGMPEVRGGMFQMTTIGLGGFFSGSGDARKGYKSKVFQKMLDNRGIIVSRIQNSYGGSLYPDKGFIAETNFKNTEFNPANGTLGLNSSDAVIPAFIAAYTNKNPKKVALTAFPSLTSALPNWNITYDGLSKVPAIAKHFSKLSLSHRYTGQYNIGSYTSHLSWVNAGLGGDLGYIKQAESGRPIPSMGYDITTVNLMESFNPLLGVDATLLNNVTAAAKIAKVRTINLNVSSYQLVEAYNDDITIGLGYKYAEFNKILKMKKKGDFSNDLTVRMDYTYSKRLSLVRKLEDGYTQATQGTISKTIKFYADYAVSRKISLKAFYDLQISEPLVSSSAFPTSNSNYGISIQVSLDQ